MNERELENAREVLKAVDGSKHRDEEMASILKSERRTFMNTIQNILILVMLVFVIFAWIDGTYIRKEIQIVEHCEGNILDEADKQILYEAGYVEDVNGKERKPIETPSLDLG